MIKVVVKNDDLDSAIKKFNAIVKADGILKEVKEKSFYEKPSVRKRRIRMQNKIERSLMQ